MNPRTIVFQSDNIRIEWNRSATFNVYAFGLEVECFTCYDVESNYTARKVAREWYHDNVPSLTW
jgi:hypothetical protein